MDNPMLPWQADAWSQFTQMKGRLPHAILFHGPQGVGKVRFAEQAAQSLLCERLAADGHACGTCPSCNWFSQYNHPDYRRVRPEILEEDGGADSEEGSDAGEKADTKKSSKTKNPSKEIKIDQVRALADFMNISTHRQGLRIVLLYPAEALNTAAANSLLKMLEEPPPGTVFLLVTHSLDRLLPTILSRCRKFAMPLPAHADALAWLSAQGVKDAEMWLAAQGGAPLAALAMAETGSREVMDEFLAMLARPGAEAALKTAERLQKVPPAELVAWLQRWLHDLFSMKLSGRIRYYPQYQKELNALARKAPVAGLQRALKAAADRRAIAEHPLSAKLFIEDMLLDYSTLFS